MKLRTKYLALALAASLLVSGATYAADQSVTANIDFEAVLTLNKTADIEFGVVAANDAGSYTISTAGAVSTTGGVIIDDSTAQPASITITGSGTQTIDITAGSYVEENGVTPSAATCDYDGGGEVACTTLAGAAAPGAGKVLLVGVTAAADGTQAPAETAMPTFTITVVYS